MFRYPYYAAPSTAIASTAHPFAIVLLVVHMYFKWACLVPEYGL